MKTTERPARRKTEPPTPNLWNQDPNPLSTAPEAQAYDCPDRPTTFQLAHLAAILATQPEAGKLPPAEVVLEACQLWDAAAKVTLSERQEQMLWETVFTDSFERWEQRLNDYVGDNVRLQELLADPRFEVERDVLPKLFPGRSETPESRRAKFEQLVREAASSQTIPDPDLNPDMASHTAVSALLIRKLLDARPRQPVESAPKGAIKNVGQERGIYSAET